MNATIHRLLSVVLAAAMTLGMLASIDHLARTEAVTPTTALAAAAAPRA